MNAFINDNAWQLQIRDGLLKPFYQEKAYEGRFIFADKGKLASILQKELAIDTVMQIKDGAILGIEEKIVRWPGYHYTNYTLEIMSCTVQGRERQGWMYTAKCNILLYCFIQENGSIEAHSIPFDKLKEWFFYDGNYLKYRSTITEQINHTECKLVPIDHVWLNISECRKFIICLDTASSTPK